MFILSRFVRILVLLAILVLVVAMLLPGSSVAQTTVVPAGGSTINVGQLVAPWLQALMAVFMALVMALLTWLTAIINKRANLANNTAVLQAEAHVRDALQTALTNAGGKAIMELGSKLDKVVIDAKTPAIANAVRYVNQAAFDSVQKSGLSPADIAEKVIAKIGVLTASNPEVAPSTVPANIGGAAPPARG